MATPRISYLIRRVQHRLYGRFEEILQPFGLTVTQYTVLSILGNRPALSSAQLSRRFAVTPQTMIKLIASLEAKQLITRCTTNANRRALEVSLTPQGHQVRAACEDAVDALEAEIFGALGEAQTAALHALLSRTLEAL